MGWKFWRTEPEKSEAQLQLEGLQSGAATAPPQAAAVSSAPSALGSTPASGAEPFRLVVEDAFTITGRGTVVTGRVEAGSIGEGMEVDLATPDGRRLRSRVIGIEAFRKRLSAASAGENVGLFLDRVASTQVPQGTVVTG